MSLFIISAHVADSIIEIADCAIFFAVSTLILVVVMMWPGFG
jgi:hypothetical protein